MTTIPELFTIGGTPTWQMPEMTHINRMPGHSRLIPFPDRDSAANCSVESSPYYRSLNGTWNFDYYESPWLVRLPEIGSLSDTNQGIQVPGVWTRQGFGIPHYTNIQMPFPNDPPGVPDENPVGVYSRTISVPQDWMGRRTIVHFGGAESVLYVYVDGRAVGMSKDSRLPSEFDLTNFVHPGSTHLLVAAVIKWSDASFIEDQDQWWMGGLHRDVYLYSTAEVSLWDVLVRAEPGDGEFGELDATLTPGFGKTLEPGFVAGCELLAPDGRAMELKVSAEIPSYDKRADSDATPHVARLHLKVPNVRLWTAETPTLYRLILWLRDPAGNEEYASIQIGFRRFAISDGELVLNGQPLRIHGVNRHEHDDVTGKAISPEAMERDVLILKANNFNAVRTAHYPNHPAFYELCDLHGLYVIDEANIECHSHFEVICNNPRWLPAFVDRVSNMVLRDKNHACIMMWSLGNESGMGSNHEAAAGWIRGFDPTRPIHYEGGISIHQSHADWHSNHRVTDVVCPMYPSHADLAAWGENPDRDPRPVILCEYSHAMGNSNGGLGEYFDIFEKYRGFQGGFIWEFVDHGLRAETPDGRAYWKYGGDFGDEPNDANFVCDGLVGPDRTLHPAVHEFRYLAQPLTVGLKEVGPTSIAMTIKNRRQFTDLSDLTCLWTLRCDGRLEGNGEFQLPRIAPGEDGVSAIDVPSPDWSKGEWHLDVDFELNKATISLPAGHRVASEQLVLGSLRSASGSPSRIVEIVDSQVLFDRTLPCGIGEATLSDGTLAGLSAQGAAIVHSALRLNLFRAPTDNDGIKLWTNQAAKPLGSWLEVGFDQLERNLTLAGGTADRAVACESWYGRKGRLVAEHKVCFHVDREWLVSTHQIQIASDLPELPRVGVALVLCPGFDRIEYFGRGPWENYPDRKRAARFGIYGMIVSDETLPYVMPQEYGHRCDCRWLRISNTEGISMEIDAAASEFGFSARHCSDLDLFASRHSIDVPVRPQTFLQLDHRHAGLGTGSCGPGRLPQHKIVDRQFEFCWRFRLIKD